MALAGCGGAGSDSDAPPDEPLPRYLKDAEGRSLILHGVNVASSAKGAPDRLPTFTTDDADRIARDWGMNFVRYLIFWDAVEPEPGVYDDAFLDAVAERLDWLADRGVHVVVDMHQDVYAQRFCCDGAPEWAIRDDGQPFELQSSWFANYLQPAVIAAFDNFWAYDRGEHADLQDHFVAAWAHVAERFRDHPAVIGYDLFNEPFSGSDFDAIEAIGGPPSADSERFDEEKLTPFYQRAIDAIREVDPNGWIFLEPRAAGPNGGAPSWLGPFDDPRPGPDHLVYFPHLYSVGVDGVGAYTSSDSTIVDWEANRMAEVQELRTPMLMGEWGLSPDTTDVDRFFRELLAMADRSTSGWAYWSYDPGWLLEGDFSEGPNVARLIRPYPRAVAGRPGALSYDPDTQVMTFDFDADPSLGVPTTIYVPDHRVYTGGFVVELDGTNVGTFPAPGASDPDVQFDPTVHLLRLDGLMGAHEVVVRPAP